MAIKRFLASADTTITNAFLEDLTTRATASNIGLADSLEVFSVYGQTSGSANGYSSELSRVLVKFPVTTGDDSVRSIQAKRNAGEIPASGSVSFFLKMYNVAHHETLPVNAKYNIFAASSSWEEGRGLDLDTYTDKTLDAVGANWMNASSGTLWAKPGGDFHSASNGASGGILYSKTLPNGHEDLEVDISEMVEKWINSTSPSSIPNYGVGIFLTSSNEAHFSSSTGADIISRASGGLLHNPDGAKVSYHTKKFSARSSEYFFKRPVIEARWDSTIKDDRGNFYYSSSLATAEENLNTLYFYNYFRGQLRNIPSIGTGEIYLNIYSGSSEDTVPVTGALTLVADATYVAAAGPTVVTGGYVSTGIYSASFAITAASTPLNTLYDVWTNGTGGVQYHTGTVNPIINVPSTIAPNTKHVSSITNLRNIYSNEETARFRVYTRLKGWSPNIYTKARPTAQVNIIESGSYEIYRIIDDLKVVPYGTGSLRHTQLSFDASGSYFDFDMSILESGYMYGIKLSYYNNSVGAWVRQPEIFKLRVED